MEKLQFENDQFAYYGPDSLNYLTSDMESILNRTFEEYKEFFEIHQFRKVEIHYFDSLEEFRNTIYEIRGEKESLPKYAKGTFDLGMIYSYMPTDLEIGSSTYLYKKYNATHELFHILYQELILSLDNLPRIIWFDEGMAQFFSHEKDSEYFEEWFSKVKNNTIEYPNLNEISHGEEFCNEKYNGYDLSYLAVHYLYDRIGRDGLKMLMRNTDDIERIGNSVLKDAYSYYSNMDFKL